VARHHSSSVLIVHMRRNTKTTSSVMWPLDTGMFLNTARFHMMAIDEASNDISSILMWLNVVIFLLCSCCECRLQYMYVCMCSLFFFSFVLRLVTGKGKLRLFLAHVKVYGGAEIQLHSLLTLALHFSKWYDLTE